MLKALLKKQLTEIFRSYFYDAKKNRARSKAGTVAYMLLFMGIMVGLLGGMFAFLSLSLCGALSAAGMDWLYFALMGLMAVLLGTFGSVFNTYSSLYLAKDNDLLLSLPIPVNTIIASRLLTVYLMGLMYSMVVLLPAVIVYWITVSLSIPVILGCLLLMLLVSVFVLTLSCTLGWVVAKISLKLKNKSFISVVVSLAFIGGYYFFYFKAQTLLQDLVANAAVYGAKIKGAAYPLYLFGRVGAGDALAMLVVSAVILALLALMWALISHSFLKIATSAPRSAGKRYREGAVKQKSVSSALLAKEFRRFLSSPNYMLNCGLGVLLLAVGGGLLIWKGGVVVSTLNAVFGGRSGSVPVLLCGAICMLASMNDMTAPSVSLEGKSLWLLQSLPVKPWQALRAKLEMQLLLTAIPTLLCTAGIAVLYPLTPLNLALTTLVPLSFVLLYALFGLTLGLKMPILTWTSEITPIKQSACVTITLFSGFAFNALLCAGYLLGGWRLGFTGYMAGFAAITLGLSAVLYFWLKKRGCNLLATL